MLHALGRATLHAFSLDRETLHVLGQVRPV
jgi:hypothetical protein